MPRLNLDRSSSEPFLPAASKAAQVANAQRRVRVQDIWSPAYAKTKVDSTTIENMEEIMDKYN